MTHKLQILERRLGHSFNPEVKTTKSVEQLKSFSCARNLLDLVDLLGGRFDTNCANDKSSLQILN